mmetsp:Transcript_22173/g.54544  ORF Transcript_22173/g.54544 Transcript_22173/m.54544 type:complete len:386 (+) Transcript_22173:594-1751(+)
MDTPHGGRNGQTDRWLKNSAAVNRSISTKPKQNTKTDIQTDRQTGTDRHGDKNPFSHQPRCICHDHVLVCAVLCSAATPRPTSFLSRKRHTWQAPARKSHVQAGRQPGPINDALTAQHSTPLAHLSVRVSCVWLRGRVWVDRWLLHRVIGSGRSGFRDAEFGPDERLEFVEVLVEVADALGELVVGHGVLVQHPTECLFVHFDLGDVLIVDHVFVELLLEVPLGAVQLLQQLGGNRQLVAAGKEDDLFDVSEGRAHDDGLVAVLLVVLVYLGHALHTGVLVASVLRLVLVVGLVPVEDASDEGRDECGFGLGARNGLAEAEEQSHVAVDALRFEFLARLDALPRRGHLDQNALLLNAFLLVQLDEVLGLLDGGVLVEGQAGVDLC